MAMRWTEKYEVDPQFDRLSEPSVHAQEPDQATPARHGRRAVRWTEKYGVGTQSDVRQSAGPSVPARGPNQALVPAGLEQPGGSRLEVAHSSSMPSGR